MVHNLTRDFRLGQRILRAVDQLSFTVHAGEIFGLLGPNGAGKTTTLRMILGLLRPSRGEVWVEGCAVSAQPREVQRRLGMVSASAGVSPWLTPRETLHYFAELYRVPSALAEQRVEILSQRFTLQSFLDQRCATLSTGQRQRLVLARALIHDPPVVLLDEPTRGLDIVGTREVFRYMQDLRSAGKGLVLCTHRLDEAERICDRMALLHQGRLRFEGTLEQLQQQTGEQRLHEMFVRLLEQSQPMDRPKQGEPT
ncbi:MAG: sodium ABC transporter ATP-binding protein [Planctomycetaceae bacterium]|nr:MAG: sodium ABC transporter ATP-binding protein [Planctomycetaceae bacterium]